MVSLATQSLSSFVNGLYNLIKLKITQSYKAITKNLSFNLVSKSKFCYAILFCLTKQIAKIIFLKRMCVTKSIGCNIKHFLAFFLFIELNYFKVLVKLFHQNKSPQIERDLF